MRATLSLKQHDNLLIESIKLLDGKVPLLALHQTRMDQARRALFTKSPVIRLKSLLPDLSLPTSGVHKIRVEYAERVLKTEVIPYQIRPINSVRVVDAGQLIYNRKFADRAGINELFAGRGEADDVLMARNGYLMDTSYANVALYDGRHWYTPSYPLLRGVRREKLLKENKVRPAMIRVRDLPNFKRMRVMNAMLSWEEMPELDAASVILGEDAGA